MSTARIIPAQCLECERTFDLWDVNDAREWFYGHDCEVTA